jgi:hypothetical protein
MALTALVLLRRGGIIVETQGEVGGFGRRGEPSFVKPLDSDTYVCFIAPGRGLSTIL